MSELGRVGTIRRTTPANKMRFRNWNPEFIVENVDGKRECPPSDLQDVGLMRLDPLSPVAGTPPSYLKVAKNDEGEVVAVRKYSPTGDSVDLRRKPSNRQQHLLAPHTTATAAGTAHGKGDDVGELPLLYSNAHVPSSSRLFTLDPCTITLSPHDTISNPSLWILRNFR
ncbi:hypothetical protein Aperf_G00000005737 [Anoplocephala perfoliata]